MNKPVSVDRRSFVGAALATGMATVVPRHVLGGTNQVAPSEKLNLAHIGMGTQGFRELGGLLSDPRVQIVAVCDPNTDSNDYIEWGHGNIRRVIANLIGEPDWRKDIDGCPGGREVGRLVVDKYYANNRQAEDYKACRAYGDFRELLEAESDLDGIKIMTPDHLHATIAISAMKRGLHVMTHKPIANRLYEGRLTVEAAKESGVATQLLAFGAAPDNGAISRRLKQGVLGTLREIHIWTNRPVWPQYAEIPQDTPPVPEGFDWQLWLGPAVDRPYHPHYTHTVFRGWYDFGGGSMADMGIYALWPVFDELDPGVPHTVQAWGTHQCRIQGTVSRVIHNDYSYPTACSFRFKFARAGSDDLELWWYDGGMQPRLPDVVEAGGGTMGREGILYVCDEGAVLAGFHGQNPVLYGKGEPASLWERTGAADEREDRRGARSASWIEACLAGQRSPGDFISAADITDTVNLGTVALRAGQTIHFDSEAMQVTNVPGANRYLRREYRPGWEL